MSQVFCEYLVQHQTDAQRKIKKLKKKTRQQTLKLRQLELKLKKTTTSLVREQQASKKATEQARAIASSLRSVIQTFDDSC
jgi:hypothetical protein